MEKQEERKVAEVQDVPQGLQLPQPPPPVPPPKQQRWWLIEIWKENREVFKALVVHTVIFFLLIEIFRFLGHRIENATIRQDQREIIETIEFYATVIALAIFGFDFIFKVLLHFWRSNYGYEGKQGK